MAVLGGDANGEAMGLVGVRLTDQLGDTVCPSQRIGQTVKILFVGGLNDMPEPLSRLAVFEHLFPAETSSAVHRGKGHR